MCLSAGAQQELKTGSTPFGSIRMSEDTNCVIFRWGGGGGALGYLGGGGCIRSLSKLKNTPKALISGQKSTLILIKTLTFSTKQTPLLLSKHCHWMNGNTYFNFRCYNPAANSEAQSLRESLGVRAACISWIVRGFRHP